MKSQRVQLKERLLQDREALEAEIVQCFEQLGPQRVILFGSVARGEMDQFSDVDVIIVMPTDKRFLDRLKDAYMAWTLPFGVDILVYTPEEFREMLAQENPFVMEATARGRIIYERSGR